MKRQFEESRFLINTDKCLWISTQQGEHSEYVVALGVSGEGCSINKLRKSLVIHKGDDTFRFPAVWLGFPFLTVTYQFYYFGIRNLHLVNEKEQFSFSLLWSLTGVSKFQVFRPLDL